MQKSDVTLSCKNLWKVFGDQALEAFLPLSQSDTADKAQKIAAVSDAGGIVACGDVNLEIKRGEFFVLMGLSGSGKSTLMRCMSRLTEPTSGQLLLDDQDFLSASNKQLRDIRRSKMGMVFQHFGLFPHMTVLQNVAYPLRVKKIKQSEREKQALHMIKLVGLEGRESAYPHQLSGGQKQRVGIARSLSVDPELWFLDEPFSALDPLIRWQMQSELLRLQTELKKTIVFVTHDFMEAVRLADRIAIMKDGQVVQVGTPEEIVLNPVTEYVSEFVKEVPRTRIIKVGQLMEPLTDTSSARIAQATQHEGLDASMTLDDALAWSALRGQSLPVNDANGQAIGTITPETLAAVINGDGTKKPAQGSSPDA